MGVPKPAVEIAFSNELPFDVVVYDSFSSKGKGNYFGTLTKMGTVAAKKSASFQPVHKLADVFIVSQASDDSPIARFEWLQMEPTKSFTVNQENLTAMTQTFAFIKFLADNPKDALTEQFRTLMKGIGSLSIIDKVNKFFKSQAKYSSATFETYMMGITATAENKGPHSAGTRSYSLSKLVELLGGTWPSELPDIAVSNVEISNVNGNIDFWAVVDVSQVPAQSPQVSKNFRSLLKDDKILVNIVFHYQFDAGALGTRLTAFFPTLPIPIGDSKTISIHQPTVSLSINPLFKFVVFEIMGDFPFTVFGQKMDAIATFTIDNLEAHVGIELKDKSSSLPAPPFMKGLHFDELALGMGLFFEPPSFAMGLQGKFHIGDPGKAPVALADNNFCIVVGSKDGEPHPEYLSFYVPKMELPTVLTLFTNSVSGIKTQVQISDLAFQWAADPLKPVVLPDGNLANMAYGFSAAVDILTFRFFGNVSVDINNGLSAVIETAPISLGPIFKLTGNGKGIQIKVDSNGDPIKNNLIRDTLKLKKLLAEAKEKTLVPAGGPQLTLHTNKEPYLSVGAKASLFELEEAEIKALIEDKKMSFELDFGNVLSEKMQCVITDMDNFSGKITYGIDKTISLPVVSSIGLGSIHLVATVDALMKLKVSSNNVTLSVGGGFDFEGEKFSIPEFTVHAHIAKMSDLLDAIASEIEKEVAKIFSSIVGNVAKWAEWAAKGIIKGVSDLAPVLKAAFKQTLKEAAVVMKGAKVAAKAVAKGLKNAYKAASKDVAEAMHAAKYTVGEISGGLKDAYNLTGKELATTLKAANFTADEVASGLSSAYGFTSGQVAKAMADAGYGAKVVAKGLKDTFKMTKKTMEAALGAAGYTASEIKGALSSLGGIFNPSHW